VDVGVAILLHFTVREVRQRVRRVVLDRPIAFPGVAVEHSPREHQINPAARLEKSRMKTRLSRK
ncbi:MAG TPA: hypothetical protein VLM40_17875, partial [Gemmata sp.]|nr:hypothetical protein [Gemmata sp.]